MGLTVKQIMGLMSCQHILNTHHVNDLHKEAEKKSRVLRHVSVYSAGVGDLDKLT